MIILRDKCFGPYSDRLKEVATDARYEDIIPQLPEAKNVKKKTARKILEKVYKNGKLTKTGKIGLAVTGGTALAGAGLVGYKKHKKKQEEKKFSNQREDDRPSFVSSMGSGLRDAGIGLAGAAGVAGAVGALKKPVAGMNRFQMAKSGAGSLIKKSAIPALGIGAAVGEYRYLKGKYLKGKKKKQQ